MWGFDLLGNFIRVEADCCFADRVSEAGVRAFLLQLLDLRVALLCWRLNFDVLDVEMAYIIGWPDLPGRFDGPVLFLFGVESDYVWPEYRAPIRVVFLAACFAKIFGAGYWLYAEKLCEFEAILRAYFDAPG